MSASGGSQERQPHRIGGSGRADPDGDSGLDSATSGEPVNVARGKLADQLRAAGRTDAAIEAAFREVPRHAFLPEMEPVQAYQDRPVVILSDGEGLPVSASTQPAMMAIMLRQLGLGPGHRVLEVGTGTGYNAALIACLVGNQESVVTIDVIPELIEQARGNLTAGAVSSGWLVP
jgi:protein-L-isoaspartate(D-aspartate) O-methyltransferase